jgi:putative nucleotidyltransferase with HDIG domain
MAEPKFEAKEAPDYRDPNKEYLPISIDGVRTGMATEFDLFVRTGEAYFLCKPRNMDINPDVWAGLKRSSPYLYIRANDRDAYFAKLNGSIQHVMNNEKVPIKERAALLTDCAVEIVDKIFEDPGNPSSIKDATELSQEYVKFINRERQAFLILVDLSSHDHYTYAHSIGVSTYAIALGRELGYTSAELAAVGLAGLLHDIGKTQVDPAIINKRGPLNELEWASMKKHPSLGAEILRLHKNLSPIVTLSAEAHHENIVGTGYPKGLVSSTLDPIVGVVYI